MNENEIRQTAQLLADRAGQATDSEIRLESLPSVITEMMKMASSMSHLPGQTKKLVVTKAVLIYIEQELDGPLETFLLTIVPPMIDSFVEVDKGQIVINSKLRNRLISCCKICRIV